MKAFHNDPKIKQKYLNRVRRHREQDHFAQGVCWETNGSPRGCAIGCTLENYDHSRYPIELGLPEWLARLEDSIFEGLPKEDAIAWPERFLSAIPVGADVEIVRHQLAIRRLDRLIEAQDKALASATDEHAVKTAIDQVVIALRQVRRCHEAEIRQTHCTVDDWSAAWSAAAESAESAESARSAAWSAAAESAESAESARSAAESAAWSASAESARSAAWSAESAAESAAAWKQEADDLIELLEQTAP